MLLVQLDVSMGLGWGSRLAPAGGGAAYAGTFGAQRAPATFAAVWQPPVQVAMASDHTRSHP